MAEWVRIDRTIGTDTSVMDVPGGFLFQTLYKREGGNTSTMVFVPLDDEAEKRRWLNSALVDFEGKKGKRDET